MSVLISGNRIVLRDPVPADVDRYADWQSHGEWRAYDAPWEGGPDPLEPERLEELCQRFIERCKDELPFPRRYAIIADREDRPLGWVTRYTQDDAPGMFFVGIDLCEDARLNQGLGTEALRLWVDYQFAHTDVPRIGLETWSFNPRMIRVAEKVGFTLKKVLPQQMHWQGEWLDLHSFVLPRNEWGARSTQ